MRHRVLGKKLDRDLKQRKALLKSLATSVFLHGKVVTTTAKAKFVRPYLEKLITKAKNSSGFNTVKELRSKLDTQEAINLLITKIAPSFEKRNGGYTRLVKTGNRDGDNAEMSRLELLKEEKKKPAPKTTKKPKKEVAADSVKVEESAKVEESKDENK